MLIQNLQQLREREQRKTNIINCLLEGKDLADSGFRDQAGKVFEIIMDTLYERGDDGMAKFALPVARRCLGAGHKPTNLRAYANAVIAFCNECRGDWRRCETDRRWTDQHPEDPEAAFMAGVAKTFYENWGVVN